MGWGGGRKLIDVEVPCPISLSFVRRIKGASFLSRLTPCGDLAPTKRGEVTMKFMMIVKSAERFGHPPKELMEAIDKLSEEANKAGSMIGGGGLGPPALGTPVPLSNE